MYYWAIGNYLKRLKCFHGVIAGFYGVTDG